MCSRGPQRDDDWPGPKVPMLVVSAGTQCHWSRPGRSGVSPVPAVGSLWLPLFIDSAMCRRLTWGALLVTHARHEWTGARGKPVLSAAGVPQARLTNLARQQTSTRRTSLNQSGNSVQSIFLSMRGHQCLQNRQLPT